MITSPILKCPSCRLLFSFKNTPKLLKNCPHTICIDCLKTQKCTFLSHIEAVQSTLRKSISTNGASKASSLTFLFWKKYKTKRNPRMMTRKAWDFHLQKTLLKLKIINYFLSNRKLTILGKYAKSTPKKPISSRNLIIH